MVGNHYTNGRDPDTFDVMGVLRDIVEATWHHKWLVLLTCIPVLGLATLYVYVWPPIYVAEATIMVESSEDPYRDPFYANWNVFRKDDARTEMELIASGPVLIDLIKKEKLTYDDIYHPVFSQLGYFWEKSWVGRNYKAIKKSLFPDKDLAAISPEELELGRTIRDMGAGITIRPVGDSNVGKLRMKGPSPRVASIANSLIDLYLASRDKRHETEARKSFQTLTQEVAQAEKELVEIENRRLAYSNKHGLAFDLQKETQQVRQLTDFEAQIASSRQQIAVWEASLREVEKQLATEPLTRTVSSVVELNSVRETAKLKRLELQAALIGVRDRYREDSPEVQEIKGDLAELEALLAEQPEKVETGSTSGLNTVREHLITSRSSLQAQLEGARAGLAVMEDIVANLRMRLADVPAMQTALVDLDRELLLAREKHTALALKRAQAAVSVSTAMAGMPSLRVVGYAMPPGGRWWPRIKILYPAALMVGLFLGVCAAQVKSLVSDRVLKRHVYGGRGGALMYGTIGIAATGRPLAVVPGGKTATIPPSEQSEKLG